MPILDSPTMPTRALNGALQGLTLLAVEDSRYAGEALRLMANRSGARLRRAESLADARRHLQLYRPDLVLIDIGLPDGSGLDLIAELSARSPKPPPLLAMSGDPGPRLAALAAGAQHFLEKPLPGLARFQREILNLLPGQRGEMAPDIPLTPDTLALNEDLARAADLLESNPSEAQRRYLASFLSGVARHCEDGSLAAATAAFRAKEGGAAQTLSGLLRHRLSQARQPFA